MVFWRFRGWGIKVHNSLYIRNKIGQRSLSSRTQNKKIFGNLHLSIFQNETTQNRDRTQNDFLVNRNPSRSCTSEFWNHIATHTLLPFCQTIPSDYSVRMGFNWKAGTLQNKHFCNRKDILLAEKLIEKIYSNQMSKFPSHRNQYTSTALHVNWLVSIRGGKYLKRVLELSTKTTVA